MWLFNIKQIYDIVFCKSVKDIYEEYEGLAIGNTYNNDNPLFFNKEFKYLAECSSSYYRTSDVLIGLFLCLSLFCKILLVLKWSLISIFSLFISRLYFYYDLVIIKFKLINLFLMLLSKLPSSLLLLIFKYAFFVSKYQIVIYNPLVRHEFIMVDFIFYWLKIKDLFSDAYPSF